MSMSWKRDSKKGMIVAGDDDPWMIGSRAMLTKSKQFLAQGENYKVSREDLKRLGQVSELLTLLNDPYIGPYKLKDCIEKLPVLAARCRREAALHRPKNEVEQIERALNVLGNRGIEKVLLELLEDMTILKSELDANPPKK